MPNATRRRQILLTGLSFAAMSSLPPRARAGMPTVRIGVLWDRSGTGAVTSGLDQVVAARLAMDDFGQFSRGYPIDLVDAEFQRRPDQAEDVARRWFAQEGVAAIFDLPGTAAPVRVQDIAHSLNRTVMNTGSFNAALTGVSCSPTATHWLDDSRALTMAMTLGMAAEGTSSWFLIAPDDVTGDAFRTDATTAIETSGGHLVGLARYPADAESFLPALTRARDSGAGAIGLCAMGQALSTQLREGRGLGLFDNGKTVCAYAGCIKDVHAMGPLETRDLRLVTGFYWNQNEPTRSFSRRFNELTGRMPDKPNAATYAAVEQFLRTVETTDTIDGIALNAAMRREPVYFFGSNGRLRVDGTLLLDMGLFRVKPPDQVAEVWDYYQQIRIIPAADVFRIPARAGCPLPP